MPNEHNGSTPDNLPGTYLHKESGAVLSHTSSAGADALVHLGFVRISDEVGDAKVPEVEPEVEEVAEAPAPVAAPAAAPAPQVTQVNVQTKDAEEA